MAEDEAARRGRHAWIAAVKVQSSPSGPLESCRRVASALKRSPERRSAPILGGLPVPDRSVMTVRPRAQTATLADNPVMEAFDRAAARVADAVATRLGATT